MGDLKRVNGNEVSWGSLKFRAGNELYTGFTAVEYGQKRERVFGWGMGVAHAPRAMSKGKYTPDPIKVTGFPMSVQALREALASESETGTSYGDTRFTGTLQYIESGQPPMTIEFYECVIVEDNASHEESPDPLKATFTLMCTKMRINGLALYDDSEER